MILSICICTFNRAQSLAVTLDSLAPAIAGLQGIEIVIVDNNSDDETAHTVARYARTLPIIYHFEGRQGLSAARNTALQVSSGELVLFTDDDTLWAGHSIRALLDEVIKHPEVGFFGGRILPHWPHGAPRWLHDPTLDMIAGVLGHYDLGLESRLIGSTDMLPFGANFTVRRQASNSIGRFDETLGALGHRRRRGEDSDFLQRGVNLGYTGWYIPRALCMHRLDPHNLKLLSLFQLGVEKGLAIELSLKSPIKHGLDQSTLAIRAVAQLVRGRGDRFRQSVIRMGIEQGAARQRHD